MEKNEADKWNFVEAVYKIGTDLDQLSVILPNWSKTEIEAYVKRFRYRAKRKLASEEISSKTAALNEWSRIIENLHQLQGSTNQPWWRKGRARLTEEPKDHSPILSKSLMYAAFFEDHYKGTSPEEPDYGEIYCYLAQLTAGKEPTQLSPGSASKVLEMLNKIKKVVNHKSAAENREQLFNLDISYLSSPKQNEGKGESSSKKSRNQPEDLYENFPLYMEEEFKDADVKPMTLDRSDPYYEEKKEIFYKKLKKVQEATASDLLEIPGMNPLELTPQQLVKPQFAVVETQNLQ